MKHLLVILNILVFFCYESIEAQVGYQKDSLQIKVYAKIDYLNNRVKDIKIRKVFCDYCTEFQKEKLAEEAYRRTFLIRNDKDVRLTNGTYNHALYLRVSKEDMANLKRENYLEQDTTLIKKIKTKNGF